MNHRFDIPFEVIDFHTHPFAQPLDNICGHKDFVRMDADYTLRMMNDLGISKVVGSVIHTPRKGMNLWDEIRAQNDEALKLRDYYGDRYIPGFHVHPAYVRESCEEIERMSKQGVKIIGELVPYIHGWKEDYSGKNFAEILDVAEQYKMIVSYHSMDEDAMDKMVSAHKNITFVAAHPGEYNEFMRQLDRMKMSENFYLDISGYGVFRHGMLKHGVAEFGAERFLFGSDYPTCDAGMYIGAVLFDRLISDEDKELIFAGNAKRLLEI